VAFLSNRDKDPDRSLSYQVLIMRPKAGEALVKLATYEGGEGSSLAWSPDGQYIAYMPGSEGKYTAYNMNRLAIVPVRGGEARVLTAKLDRNILSPEFSSDGKSVYVLVEDDTVQYPARVSVADGSVTRLVNDKAVISSYCAKSGNQAVIGSDDMHPEEVQALEAGKLRKLSHENDAFLAPLKLSPMENVSFKDKDGVEVHGLLVKPLDYQAGDKYPLLLRIHGGPNGQDAHEFRFDDQIFAANGYAVLNVNYRGSAGRGESFQRAIFADWGDKEVADLLAGVDHVIAMGVADPERLGIGGWSYGGILTDYTIATDPRFKAAISGAGSANQISMYGVDEYVYQYDNELGPPWKNPDAWVKISYPFFKADRIHTPTLFMGGDKDFNVPLVGSEQMYQALRTLDVPTELVVYPGEFHGFTRPSFVRDRLHRYLNWYGKYLKGAEKPAVAQTKAP
ncbi:MAG: S9 family peptidase, partial [Acidobacteriales bacterium]|nr:S9 family peptidase [Terriglobales bacterium]